MEDKISSDEISLKELLLKLKIWIQYLTSKWIIIIIVSFIGALIGLTYSILKKPTYTATLTFALEEGGNSGGGVLNLASQFGFDLGTSGGGAFAGANLIELFKSRTMVEKTLLSPVVFEEKKISLAEMYIEVNELREGWVESPKLRNIVFEPDSDRKGFTRVQDSLLGTVYSDIVSNQLTVAQRDKKVDVIAIDVISKHELFSKYLCEALAVQVSNFYVDTKTKKAKENLDILQRQTDSVRGSLNGAITSVAISSDNTFGLNPALNVRRVPTAKRQFDVQANTAILTEIVKQLELAKVTFRKETPLIQVIDRPILPLEKKRFGKTKGIVFGGIIGGFLIMLFLIVKRLFLFISKERVGSI